MQHNLTARQLLTDALNGETPVITPLSCGSWMTGDPYTDDLYADPWKRLYDRGLGLSHHCQVTRHIEHGVEETVKEENRDGNLFIIREKRTPVGNLRHVRKNGWVTEHWIKTRKDYRVMTWIVENTEQISCYEEYSKELARLGELGVVVILASRTPIMSINVDWAGLEQFCMDIALQIEELYELYEAGKKFFLEETRLIAGGPGRFVKWPENLTSSMLGPERYDELLTPVYEEAVPIMEEAGKRVMVHYDGALSGVADRIAAAPVHIIESLTEPPEGDMSYDGCRKVWPDKTFWGNINQGIHSLPESGIRRAIMDRRRRAGKTAFAFEAYETLPVNWADTFPVILDTLQAMD